MTTTEPQGTFAASTAKTLAQIVAAEKGVKSRVMALISQLYKNIQKAGEKGPMEGISRTYQKRFDEGAELPAEYRKVQFTAEDQLTQFVQALRGLMDVTATKDLANTRAKATVRVGDTVIIEDAPPTLLLSLEKQLTDLRTFVAALPVLDPATEWTFNPEAGAYAARPVGTTRTEKERRATIVAPATDKHQAQVDIVNVDVIVGTWNTVRYSGYMAGDRVKELLDRVDRLLLAVKYAREEANASTEAQPVRVGSTVATYLLG